MCINSEWMVQLTAQNEVRRTVLARQDDRAEVQLREFESSCIMCYTVYIIECDF